MYFLLFILATLLQIFQLEMEPFRKINPIVRILIVEDDEEMGSLLRDFVEEEGFEADTVMNGYEAFRKLVKEPFDLIITDIRMPGLTGLDILPRIRKLQPGIPIVVITAFGSQEVHQKALERGAMAYLEKPIHFHRLRELIYQMVSSPLNPNAPLEREENDRKR
jgi:DNA-binding response OmpR family regulator